MTSVFVGQSVSADTRSQLTKLARLTAADLELIQQRRRDHNRLGFAYQLAHVRLFNRFPTQQPFEIIDDVVLFIGLQLDISPDLIGEYSTRRETDCRAPRANPCLTRPEALQ